MEGESNENSKLGANLLALQIIKVQFALNKFDLCDRFFKDLYSEEEMPKSWRVNVSYYKGRFHMYSNDFVQAQRHLKNALELCHDQGLVNQKKILKYLIPVEMNKGNYPSPDLLRKYDLEQEYLDIVRSVTDGNLAALEKAMNKNQDSFIQSGVFITMERLRMVTLRNFVKRVAAAVQAEPRLQYKEKKTQIQLQLIFRPLQREWDPELDLDELEFLLTNLISMGLIKGYISHELRILVLMATDAFPEPA